MMEIATPSPTNNNNSLNDMDGIFGGSVMLSPDLLVDSLRVMHRQSTSRCYKMTSDYISKNKANNNNNNRKNYSNTNDSSYNNSNNSNNRLIQGYDNDVSVDMDCRMKMISWCYQIVDFCNFERRTVEIAMRNLDRFLNTHHGRSTLNDRQEYQLAVMTSLYNAIKIHEAQAIDPNVMSQLSHGNHSKWDIEQFEFRMLMALQWSITPPTAVDVCRYLMSLLMMQQPHVTDLIQETVIDLAIFQTELALSDYHCCCCLGIDAFTIAYASLLNAMDTINDPQLLTTFVTMAKNVIHGSYVPMNQEMVDDLRVYLYKKINDQSFDDDEEDEDGYHNNNDGEMVPPGTEEKMENAIMDCDSTMNSSQSSFQESPRCISS